MKILTIILSLIIIQGIAESSHFITISSGNISIEINKDLPVIFVKTGSDEFKIFLRAYSNSKVFIDPWNGSFKSSFSENDNYQIFMNGEKNSSSVNISFEIDKDLKKIDIGFKITGNVSYLDVILSIMHYSNNSNSWIFYYDHGNVYPEQPYSFNISRNNNELNIMKNITSNNNSISGIFLLGISSSEYILLFPMIYFIFGIILGVFLIIILILIWKKLNIK